MTAPHRIIALAAALAVTAAAAAPASAQLDSFLFGKPGTKSLSGGVFEVTARSNKVSEPRSALDKALVKAAKKAAKEKAAAFAVLLVKSGSWMMNRGPIGLQTTLRFKLCAPGETVLDERGAPARVYSVAELLAGER